jgi:uncharacterized protein
MDFVIQISQAIIRIFWQMAPYLFFGLTIAGVLHVFFAQDFIVQHLGKSDFASVFKAAILGVPVPLCSCGVIPTALSLRENKASQGATISFLISTPQTGVDSIIATYGILGLVFAVFRPLIAFLLGIIGGVAINLFCPQDLPHQYQRQAGQRACLQCQTRPQVAKIKLAGRQWLQKIFTYAYFDFLDDISVNLGIGIVLAGLLAWLIPPEFFTQYLQHEFLTMLLMIIAGVPLYICATASLPVAAALMLKGLSPGAAFVFLAVGPATNAATMTMILSKMGRRVFLIYLTVITLGALGAGYLLNLIFNGLGLTALNLVKQPPAHIADSLLLTITAWLLLGFLVLSFLRKIKLKLLRR